MTQVAQNILRVKKELTAFPSAQLLAISKKQSLAKILAAIEAGQTQFGENFVQEATEKLAQLPQPLRKKTTWHMVGHVQSRKASQVVSLFDWVESVDSLKLALKLDQAAAAMHKKVPILLQVNVAGEDSKSGLNPSDLTKVVAAILNQTNHLQLRGLMTMPPLYTDPTESIPHFQKMASLLHQLQRDFPGQEWTELSMGTSHDYKVALKHGATIVRLGSNIFGARDYKNR